METAPRNDTSSSGNSARAKSDAEYTEAPASFTTTTCGRSPPTGGSSSRMAALVSVSVSRLAVPLPMAISSGVKRCNSERMAPANRSS